jgi:hypothetical protein
MCVSQLCEAARDHVIRCGGFAEVDACAAAVLGCDVLQSEQRQPGYDISTYAAVCLLRGRAFEALENRQRAITCYTAALQ